MTPITKLVIDRSKWLPWEVQRAFCIHASLKDEKTGRMCCLGFACVAAGVSDFVYNRCTSGKNSVYPYTLKPYEANKFNEAFPKLAYSIRGYAQMLLAEANDNVGLDLSEREAKITELFAKAGVEVEFVGELGI